MSQIKYKNWFIPLMILSLIILVSIIPLIRFYNGDPVFISGDNYTFLNSANTNTYSDFATFVFGFIMQQYLFLNYLLPILFGIITIFLFSGIAKHYSNTPKQYYVSLSLLVTMPAFLLAHVSLTYMSLFFLLVSFCFLTYLNNNSKINFKFICSMFLFALFFPLQTIILLILFTILHMERLKQDLNEFYVLLFAITSAIIILIILPISFNFIYLDEFNIANVFSFLGADFGYSLIITIFGLLGIYSQYGNFSLKELSLISSYFILSFFVPYLIAGMILFFILFSTKSIFYWFDEEWVTGFLKYATIILICCVLFFSISTIVQEKFSDSPTTIQVDALKYINQNKLEFEEGKILTNVKYSSFIEYYSGLKPYNIYGDESKQLVSNAIFYSRKYPYIVDLMKTENIKYILIDEKMINGAIWPNNREDLLFVLEQSSSFKKIYDKSGVQVYVFEEIVESTI